MCVCTVRAIVIVTTDHSCLKLPGHFYYIFNTDYTSTWSLSALPFLTGENLKRAPNYPSVAGSMTGLGCFHPGVL